MPSKLAARIERLERERAKQAQQDIPIKYVIVASAHHDDEILDVMVFGKHTPGNDAARDRELVNGLVRTIWRAIREAQADLSLEQMQAYRHADVKDCDGLFLSEAEQRLVIDWHRRLTAHHYDTPSDALVRLFGKETAMEYIGAYMHNQIARWRAGASLTNDERAHLGHLAEPETYGPSHHSRACKWPSDDVWPDADVVTDGRLALPAAAPATEASTDVS